jgi:hypothetical protein
MSDNDTNLAEWGAADIAQGALENAAQSLLGYGLSSLGVGFPDATGDALASLQSEMNLIENQLKALQNELDVVKASIARDEYDTRYALMTDILAPIRSLSQQLATVVTEKAANPNGNYSTDQTTIMDLIGTSLLDNQPLISMQVLGPAGGKSLYEICSIVCKDNHRFLSKADYDLVMSQVNYYQSMQFSQLLLMVNYYHAHGDSEGMVTDAISNYQANITKENIFHIRMIFPGVAIDQQTNLMLYTADCPYVPFSSAPGILATWDANYVGDAPGWRLPTRDEIGSIFAGYDSKGGTVTPPQWLMNNGVQNDMTGVHFWTSDVIPGPDRRQYGRDVLGYDRDLNAWKALNPQHYYVDSATLDANAAQDSASAHVMGVRKIFPWEGNLLEVLQSQS